MIKLIVSDLDGTLLRKDITVLEEDRVAILDAIEDGIDICIATGRNDKEIKEVLKTFNKDFHRISQNGAFAYLQDNQAVFSQTFDPNLAKQIFDIIKDDSVVPLISNFDTNFMKKHHEYFDEIQEKMFHPIVINPDIDSRFESIQPSKLFLIGMEEDLALMKEKLQSEYSSEVDIFFSAKYVLDIMPKNISKGNAVKQLIDHLQIKPNEIACIGDSFNDIPMFNLTPYSFAISHAHEDVKKEATYIVDSVKDAVTMIIKENKLQSHKIL